MEFDLIRYIATTAGYAVPLALLYFVTGRFTETSPALWHGEQPDPDFEKPRVELALAFVAVVGIIVFNILYSRGMLIPADALGGLGFFIDLLIIWSPIAILLVWRKQSLGTCLLVPEALPQKVIWGVFASILGMVTFLVITGRADELGLAFSLLGAFDPIKAFQSGLQFFGVGFLLYRIVAAAGKTAAIVVCSVLYGVVKYPYYMGQLGMGWPEATSIIAFSIAVAFFVMWVIYERRDVLVVAILHIFIDLIQNS